MEHHPIKIFWKNRLVLLTPWLSNNDTQTLSSVGTPGQGRIVNFLHMGAASAGRGESQPTQHNVTDVALHSTALACDKHLYVIYSMCIVNDVIIPNRR